MSKWAGRQQASEGKLWKTEKEFFRGAVCWNLNIAYI